ncbi:hypothetical protein D3C74_418760 [compost metagenome]
MALTGVFFAVRGRAASGIIFGHPHAVSDHLYGAADLYHDTGQAESGPRRYSFPVQEAGFIT